ncbi:MAG: pilus assembly protein PilM, partial [Patescibacteria group bacterium]|nr:pilus assembly protein PilM [Patescibacteria group bacterium]
MFGFTKSKFPIGLDISDLSLKFIQLKKRGKKIEIQSVGKKKLPKGIIENGLIINQEAALKALKELFAKPIYGNTASNEIVACLPDTKTFIKLINVEKGPNDIADIINTEIEKNVPLGVKDIYYDWQEVASDGQNQQILIGAAPKQIVNQYIDLINKTKYKIAALEIESTAICRSLLKEETPKFDIQQAKNY